MSFLPKDYVPVHTRVQQFHDKYPLWSILTDFKVEDWTAILKATIQTWDWRIFNWTSFWEIRKEKALEKLETVAVWRALAFAWFEIKSWIASQDEMEKFDEVSKQAEKVFESKLQPLPDEQWTWKQGQSFGKCAKCWAENVKSPKTWKIFCKNKCWTK